IYVAPATADSAAGSVHASVLAAGLLPCLRFGPESVAIEACARVLVGGLFGEATGVGVSTPTTEPYAAIGAELAAEIVLGARFGIRMHASPLATVTRTFLRIRQVDKDVDVWSSPFFSASGGVEAVLHFP